MKKCMRVHRAPRAASEAEGGGTGGADRWGAVRENCGWGGRSPRAGGAQTVGSDTARVTPGLASTCGLPMPSVWQVDSGGAIGFRNSPDLKDAADPKTAPPAKPLSTWEATEEQDGWIKTTNGLWLPTEYMDKVNAAAKQAPEAAAASSYPYYQCVKKNQSRTGFEMGSDKAAVLAPPMVTAPFSFLHRVSSCLSTAGETARLPSSAETCAGAGDRSDRVQT